MSAEEPKSCIQIKGPEYVLRCNQSLGFTWDLYLLKVVNKGKPNEKYEFKPVGYGMKLETCIRNIITYRAKIRGKKLSKGDSDLMMIMKLWMEEKTKLLSAIDFTEEEWNKLTKLKRIPLDQLKQRDLVNAEIVETSDDEEETEEETED